MAYDAIALLFLGAGIRLIWQTVNELALAEGSAPPRSTSIVPTRPGTMPSRI